MADSVSLNVSVDGIGGKLNQMLSRGQLTRGWLNRVAYPMIVEAQRIRWASEGASEGRSWQRLNPAYAMYKLKKFAEYPGGGSKMLIATGKLVASMTGDQTSNHFKLVEDERILVGTTLDYARYVDEARNITNLGQDTKQALQNSLRAYLSGGEE